MLWRTKPPTPPRATYEPVQIRQIPPSVFTGIIRALPDARTTRDPQARIVDIPGVGQVRLWFAQQYARVGPNAASTHLSEGLPYWRFDRAEKIPEVDALSNPPVRPARDAARSITVVPVQSANRRPNTHSNRPLNQQPKRPPVPANSASPSGRSLGPWISLDEDVIA